MVVGEAKGNGEQQRLQQQMGERRGAG